MVVVVMVMVVGGRESGIGEKGGLIRKCARTIGTAVHPATRVSLSVEKAQMCVHAHEHTQDKRTQHARTHTTQRHEKCEVKRQEWGLLLVVFAAITKIKETPDARQMEAK